LLNLIGINRLIQEIDIKYKGNSKMRKNKMM